MTLGPGPIATLLVVPAVVVADWSILDHLRRAGVRDIGSLLGLARSLDAATYVLAPTWAAVAVVSLLASVVKVKLFGIGEPIVRLTTVHYLYAGVGTLTIAWRLRRAGDIGDRLATLAVAASAAAPLIVAAGFVLGQPLPQIGGAALMTIGVWSSAVVLFASVRRSTDTSDWLLRSAAGLTPWVPMVLALAWATAQHVAGTPAFSVPDMARFHGLANGIGFVFLGLLATRDAAASETGPSWVGATP